MHSTTTVDGHLARYHWLIAPTSFRIIVERTAAVHAEVIICVPALIYAAGGQGLREKTGRDACCNRGGTVWSTVILTDGALKWRNWPLSSECSLTMIGHDVARWATHSFLLKLQKIFSEEDSQKKCVCNSTVAFGWTRFLGWTPGRPTRSFPPAMSGKAIGWGRESAPSVTTGAEAIRREISRGGSLCVHECPIGRP